MSHSQIRSRVRIMFLWIMCGMIAGVLVQSFRIALGKKRYRSEAKLIVAGLPCDLNDGHGPSHDGKLNLASTIIETITSNVIHRRALERVRALNPELKECEVTLKASQIKDSAIFHVSALGDDAVYIRHFLNALLDEHIALRHDLLTQRRAAIFKPLFDEFEKKRIATIKAANSPESKLAVGEVYKELETSLGWFQSYAEEGVDCVAIFERATVGSVEARDWILPLLAGAGLGAIGGIVLFYVTSMFFGFRTIVAET